MAKALPALIYCKSLNMTFWVLSFSIWAEVIQQVRKMVPSVMY
jgi:hypothetical protein